MITAATNLIVLFESEKQTEYTKLAVLTANKTQHNAAIAISQSNENEQLIKDHANLVILHANITSTAHDKEIKLLNEILNQTKQK